MAFDLDASRSLEALGMLATCLWSPAAPYGMSVVRRRNSGDSDLSPAQPGRGGEPSVPLTLKIRACPRDIRGGRLPSITHFDGGTQISPLIPDTHSSPHRRCLKGCFMKMTGGDVTMAEPTFYKGFRIESGGGKA